MRRMWLGREIVVAGLPPLVTTKIEFKKILYKCTMYIYKYIYICIIKCSGRTSDLNFPRIDIEFSFFAGNTVS